MTNEAETEAYESLRLGTSESCSRVIDGHLIDAFANIIQSFSPLHMDGDWARANTQFPDRLAHGVLTAALMSKPMAQFCSRFGIRAAMLSSSARYIKPVIVGDTIATTVQLAEKIDAKRHIRFSIEAKNQNGEIVLIGDAVEKVLN